MSIQGNIAGNVNNVGNYNSGIIAETISNVIFQSNKSTQESLSQKYLENDWPRSVKARYNANLGQTLAREPCTPGTRIDILDRIIRWVDDPSSEGIFWLNGPPGSGKSTIGYSITSHFDRLRTGLGANFFCSRLFEDTRERHYIIPAIVEQLARHCDPYAQALLQGDKFDSVHIPSQQMKDLLVLPWNEAMNEHQGEFSPLLIVIDALDEVEHDGGSAFLAELLTLINENPIRGLTFLVTSRPNPEIVQLCSSFTSDVVCRLFDVPKDTVKVDVAIYLDVKLPKLQRTPELHELLRQADGLFIFAVTVVRFITPRSKMALSEQLQLLKKIGIHAEASTLVRNSNTTPVDALDRQLMSAAFEDLDGQSSAMVPRFLPRLHVLSGTFRPCPFESPFFSF